MLPNATPIELLWALSALLAFGMAGLGTITALRDAWALNDPTAVARLPRGTARRRRAVRLARVFIRYESLLLYLAATFLYFGGRACLLPPNPTVSDVGAAISGSLFFVGGLLLTGVSVFNRLARRANDLDRGDGP